MAPAPDGATSKLGRWSAFLALCTAMFMAILDIQVVASSLVVIQDDLLMEDGLLVWIQTAYLTAEVLGIALSGRFLNGLGMGRAFGLFLSGFIVFSVACGLSTSPEMLIACRAFQGLFAGGMIPLVFSAVFLLFEQKDQPKATAVAGSFAMLAPTVGPWVGGTITDALTWHWVFFINVPIGLAALCFFRHPVLDTSREPGCLTRLSFGALILTALALIGLEVGLKYLDELDWATLSSWLLPLGMVSLVGLAIRSLLRAPEPILDLTLFQERGFAISCVLSFVLGMGIFGAVYLLPVYLGLVMEMGPLQIGTVMIVMGAAQLLAAAPSALVVDRYDCRMLSAVGFGLFAMGCAANGFQTTESGFDDQFWPQVLRGAAVLLCVLPATAMAMALLPPERVGYASTLFNLMRNLGGAVGLGCIDLYLSLRAQAIGEGMQSALLAGDRSMAEHIGLKWLDQFDGTPIDPDLVDPLLVAVAEKLVRATAITEAMNETWLWLGLLCLSVLPLLVLIPKTAAFPAQQNQA
ncbi:MAG: DHA2 family efflux MFS transporter permease subunit [Rhodospirillaceae bacterium]